MINPVEINLADLPSFSLSDRHLLPLGVKHYFHATASENVASILQHGFEDRTKSGRVAKPGVWLGDLPAITGIGLDQFLDHLDEAWIAVIMPSAIFEQYVVDDPSWFCTQAKLPAAIVNQCPMFQISLKDVINIRKQFEIFFLSRFLSALDSSTEPNWDVLVDREEREWCDSALASARVCKRVEQEAVALDRYLETLRVVADCYPEEWQDKIQPRVQRSLTIPRISHRQQRDAMDILAKSIESFWASLTYETSPTPGGITHA